MNQISRAGKGVAPCWTGVNEVTPQTVPDPRLVDPEDVVVRRRRDVRLRPALLGGHIPFMRKGDVLGHEFVGEVVEIGPQVRKHRGGYRLEAAARFVGCETLDYERDDVAGELLPAAAGEARTCASRPSG